MVPPSTISWQTAIKAVFMDKVIVVKNHDDWFVRSQKLTMPVPSIVMIRKYVKNKSRVSFNRKNLFMRDNYNVDVVKVNNYWPFMRDREKLIEAAKPVESKIGRGEEVGFDELASWRQLQQDFEPRRSIKAERGRRNITAERSP